MVDLCTFIDGGVIVYISPVITHCRYGMAKEEEIANFFVVVKYYQRSHSNECYKNKGELVTF